MLRKVFKLLTGNLAAQFVNVATILLVVSLYVQPGEFGRYAAVVAAIGLISSVACLRFEIATVAVQSELEARNLVFAAAAAAVAVTAAATIAALLARHVASYDILMGIPIWIAAAALLLKCGCQVVASIYYRVQAYGTYSFVRFLQAVVLFLTFWWAGRRGGLAEELTMSLVASYAAFLLFSTPWLLGRPLRHGVSRRRIAASVRRHRGFVFYNTPHAFLDNVLANGLPIVLVALSGATVAGYFGFMQRLLRAPLGLVFTAVSQVLFRHVSSGDAPKEFVKRDLIRVLALTLAILSAAVVAIALVVPSFDRIEFFSEWRGLREYVLPFSVWMLASFVFAPFSTLPVVYGEQRRYFGLSASYNVATLALIAFLLANASVHAAFTTSGIVTLVYCSLLVVWVFRLSDRGHSI